MYLEERVEQLEHLATDQGRQNETIAKGLAELTTDARAIRQDMTQGFTQTNGEIQQINIRMDVEFKRVNERFERIDEKFEHVDEKLKEHNQEFAQIKVEFKRVNDRFDDMQQTQQLILKILNDRL